VVPQADNLRVAVLEMMHAAPWAAHVGRRRTAYITKQIFWWPHMQSDIDYYVQHCDLCQRNKARHQNAENMLVPLPVPERPWEMIGVDFIPSLPKTKNGYDSICVISCHFSKLVHLIPCKTDITAPEFAKLFRREFFRLHGRCLLSVIEEDSLCLDSGKSSQSFWV
jgi:hypothetical protein